MLLTPCAGRAPTQSSDAKVREEGAEGFAVEAPGAKGMEAAGWLRHYHPETVEAMHVLGYVVRSPVALARVMQAAGALALEMAGEIVGRRMMGE